MIFFFRGRPSALFMYQTSLTWLSFACELDCRIVALGREQMAKRELTHLRRSGLDQLFVAVAQRRAPQPRHPFDIGLALRVVDEHALAALDDQRTGFAQRRKIGVGVNEGFHVEDAEIAERGHGTPRHGAAAGRGCANGTASSPGSRTSHWHMRWPPARSAKST